MRVRMMLVRTAALIPCLLIGPALAGAPTYIEPGSGVGVFSLGDTLKTVRAKMGNDDPTRVVKRGDSLLVMYDKAGLVFIADTAKTVKAVHVSSANLVVAGTSIGVGSTAGDVRTAFGTPDGERKDSPRQKKEISAPRDELSYAALGVRFLMEEKTQLVREIAVFRGSSGQAR
jgi:hypothetical protein